MNPRVFLSVVIGGFLRAPLAIRAQVPSSSKDDRAGYRPDVDGLRAVAVLSVLLFHLNKLVLPGGFLGVDIFFVISGFLITRNILQDVERGQFSIAEFYRRRIKRIAPVMLAVVAVTFFASQLLLLPEDAQKTARSTVFSLASLANVYFWKYQDRTYFALDSAQIPLLHLWSLGVEEQFYLLWPVLLVVFYRPVRTKALLASAAIVAALSFLMGDILYDVDPSFVYYMLPTRAGELLLGVFVALAVMRQVERRIRPSWAPLIATGGALVLAASLFLVTEHQRFPGWRAILPTAATASLILAGHCGENFWSRLLAIKPLVWVGLLSYSAYLWHWPLLALFRYGYGEPGPAFAAVAVVVTLLLAWLSYRYIEQPARRSSAPLLRVLTQQYLLPAGALVVLALVVIHPERLGVAISSESYRLHLNNVRDGTRPAFQFDWICQRQRITPDDVRNPRCVVGRDSSDAPTAVLWGDSHAAHYVGMVEAFARSAGFRFRNVEIGSCPPLYGDPTPFVDAKRAADCRASLALVRSVVDEFPVVIMSSAWVDYQSRSPGYLATVFETIDTLARENKLVIVLGEVAWIPGYDRRCREKALSYPFLRCPEVSVPLSPAVAEVNGRLKGFAEHTEHVRYFDANAYLCPDGVCTAFGPTGEPRYFDEKHLALMASAKLGREIIRREGVPRVFSTLLRGRGRLSATGAGP